MPTTVDAMREWCQQLLSDDSPSRKSLDEYLAAIGRIEALDDLPAGTRVLIRGDVDAKPGAQVGDGDVRLRSMVDTLQHGRQHGWVQIIFGHIGRKPEGSLEPVAQRIGELLGCQVELLDDWLDEATMTISATVAQKINSAPNGAVFVLQNTRKYDIERVLWKAEPADAAKLAEPLAKLANQFAEKVAKYYINEALSAGNLDTSSTVVPAAMERSVLGKYVAGEFDGPMQECRRAKLVVFSGLKIDKLDDLQAIIDRGHVQMVISAGSLAMALKKADAELNGKQFSLGVAEDPAEADKPYYIPPERIEQAKQMLAQGRSKGVEFVLPVDFILADGSVSETLGAGQQQLDVGPQSSELFEAKVGEFIQRETAGGEKPVAFHNGVFGKFEDEQFAEGTRKFVSQLKRMHDAGVQVYVGGGEGSKSLERYGQEDWVTHNFTAGGTVLTALGNQPIPYLQTLYMAAKR